MTVQHCLRGEALQSGAPGSGWTLVTVDGYPLGWVKLSGGLLGEPLPTGPPTVAGAMFSREEADKAVLLK
ncbi:methyltransferase RsmF C-terminal domain-like protein [Paenibacillus mucilaginosus]|uniref:methyltransferase RsmF C-terminal domain-like protein n=1 Tax=Paenibacillus mucilaginosus TaxID=61624 RepID=UPI0009D9683C|nr:hypothetical protein [Paenibacillus mucilaginosus]WDM31178.1 hypothetical protein KCX80_09860 [Paenibacillus mucilaginosus]WFA22526.1 hypothetical protein ERY13_10130 [Paenibacillus mucilaginosus]